MVSALYFIASIQILHESVWAFRSAQIQYSIQHQAHIGKIFTSPKYQKILLAHSFDIQPIALVLSNTAVNTTWLGSYIVGMTFLMSILYYVFISLSLRDSIYDDETDPISKSFVFDPNLDIHALTDPIQRANTPTYLLSGILSGLNILPIESKLKSNSQFGRRVQYQSFRNIPFEWSQTSYLLSQLTSATSMFNSIKSSTLERLVSVEQPNGKDVVAYGTLRIYKFNLLSNDISEINRIVTSRLHTLLSSDDPYESRGIAVSNAGGYHSDNNCFSNGHNKLLGEICANAVYIAETDDMIEASYHDKNNSMNRIRNFDTYTENESWINRNHHGNWNSLHTHTGSEWSGIYYVQTANDYASRSFSGNLLIKPTPHATEANKLNDMQNYRLNIQDTSCITSRETQVTECCDYLEFTPEVGTLLLFPGYLQHAVMPLSILQDYRNIDRGARISFAFNFAQKL